MDNLTPAYIYPLGDKADVLNFFLYPDTGEISLGSGGGSAPHPSYGHSVKQLTGRLSPTFSYSLIFEGVAPMSTRAGSAGGSFDHYSINSGLAQVGFDWFMRNVGPRGTGQYRDEAQQFVMCLWESGSQLVSLDKVKLTPMIVSRAKGTENVIRRFRADVQGEYIYPVQIDQGLFKKKRRPKRPGATVAQSKQALAVVDATLLAAATASAVFEAESIKARLALQLARQQQAAGQQVTDPQGMALLLREQLAGVSPPRVHTERGYGEVITPKMSIQGEVIFGGGATVQGAAPTPGPNPFDSSRAFTPPVTDIGITKTRFGNVGSSYITGGGEVIVGGATVKNVGVTLQRYGSNGSDNPNTGVGGGGQSRDDSQPASVLVAKKAY